MRLFIAVRFSPAIMEALNGQIAELKKRAVSGKCTAPENLHLTLAFIGECTRVRDIQRCMDRVSAEPFSIALGKSGSFRGGLHWVGLRRCDALTRMAEELRRELAACGIPVDSKPFRPHITLMREGVFPEGEPSVSPEPVEMTVSEITLMESRREGGRLVYRPVYTKRLGK